jgi:hypothetical protein
MRVIKSRMMKWAGYVARMEEMRTAYTLVGKPEGKRLLRRPRLSWENNIQMDLKEIECEVIDWIHLAQDIVLC